MTGTYSTLINTISTSQNIIDNNSTGIYKLSTQYTTFQTLSIGVALLDIYSSIRRPQTFYEMNFYLNNMPISTYYLPSTLSADDIITNQSIAATYLENQFNYNSTILSSLFATNTSNAYFDSSYEKALKINRKVFGEEHLDVASSLYHLASLYHNIGQYKKAQSLYEQALKIRQKLFLYVIF